MLKAYVLKKGGKFVSRKNLRKLTRNVSRAELFMTRDDARVYKEPDQKIYRLVLGLNSVEKVR